VGDAGTRSIWFHGRHLLPSILGAAAMKKGFKTYTNSVPDAEDVSVNNKAGITLGELLAEYDINVLKRWAVDQHLEEAAQEVPEERK
jgi:SpoVK/Ycf46/Vps4 family AAA+-type ATPase